MMLSRDSDVEMYHEIDDEEGTQHQRPPTRIHGLYGNLSTIIFALGWAITLSLYWQLSIATRRTFTPIPSYIFHSSPKVFHHDDDWSGMSKETQRRWSAQFAGNSQQWRATSLSNVRTQEMVRFGLRIQSALDFRAASLRSLTTHTKVKWQTIDFI